MSQQNSASAQRLSAQLQFEGVGPDGREFSEQKPDELALDDTAVSAEDSAKGETGRRRRRRQFVTSPTVTDPEIYMPRSQMNTGALDNFRRRDQFARYAASFALLGLVAFAVAIYTYTQIEPKNEAALSYFSLPQAVINVDGQIARMQVTIQVDAEDEAWLEENKSVIGDIFQIVVSRANPVDLRTPAGFEAMQSELKNEINAQMKVNKVQAVLLTELLTQTRH